MEKNIKTCPYSSKCGGCSYLETEYSEQLRLKKKHVSNLLKPYCEVKTIHGAREPYFYRNKVTRSLGMDNKKHPVAGIYAGKSHEIVPVDICLIEDEASTRVMKTIKELFKSFKLKYYDENTGYGLIRHVQIRTARGTGEMMVTIVTASPVFPSKQNFAKALKARHPEITTIVQNINMRTDSLVLSDRENVLYGPGFIYDTLCGKRLKISSRSFYQVNHDQTEWLYSRAVEMASLTGNEIVIDAYSGIGTIGIVASDKAKRVIGAEINKEAVKDAVANARANKINNVSFYAEDAGVFMEKVAAEGKKVDVVFMDPPRNGSSEAFLKALLALKPDRIVYISCGPESLAGDLKKLADGGYKVEKAECVDMFPFTEHVETVCLLVNQNAKAKQHVNVGIDAEEYYRIKNS